LPRELEPGVWRNHHLRSHAAAIRR
jgi:hypothetical protein